MDEAERLYRAAEKADPTHANHLGNFAGFLFSLGREAEAYHITLDHCDRNPYTANPKRTAILVTADGEYLNTTCQATATRAPPKTRNINVMLKPVESLSVMTPTKNLNPK